MKVDNLGLNLNSAHANINNLNKDLTGMKKTTEKINMKVDNLGLNLNSAHANINNLNKDLINLGILFHFKQKHQIKNSPLYEFLLKKAQFEDNHCIFHKNSNKNSSVLITYDETLNIKVLKCNKCGILFTSKVLSDNSLKEFYGLLYWKEMQRLHGYPDIFDRLPHDLHKALTRITYIKKFVNKGKLLDVGCSNGALLLIGKLFDFDVCGLEINHSLAKMVGEKFNLKIVSSYKYLSPSSFDVITLFDVFEHFKNPLNELGKIKTFLTAKGIIIIETFRINPVGENNIKKMEDFKPLEHYFFLKETDHLKIFNKLGLKIIEKKYPLGQNNPRVLYTLSL